jgi:hypothetical protein
LVLFSFAVLLAFILSDRNDLPDNSMTSSAEDSITVKPTLGSKLQKIFSQTVDVPADKAGFEAKMSRLMNEMPTLTTQAKPRADSNGEIHGFLPEEFLEGHKLAQLRKLTLENEEFLPSSQNAYAGCAERSDLAESVRAVCFMRAMEISIKLKNPEYVVGLNVPADVRELALKLVN